MTHGSDRDISSIIRKQLAQYMLEWKRHTGYEFLIAVRDVARLERHAATRGARVVPLEATRGTCYVVTDATCSDLWVRTFPVYYTAYKNAFIRFAARYHKVSLSGRLAGYNVDHLFNSARAEAYGMGFVRVGLVAASANQSWGRTYEQRITTREPTRYKDVYPGTEITFAKILGMEGPRSEAQVSGVANRLVKRLLEAGLVRESEQKNMETRVTSGFQRAYDKFNKVQNEAIKTINFDIV